MIIKQIFNIHWCFFYDQSEVEKKKRPSYVKNYLVKHKKGHFILFFLTAWHYTICASVFFVLLVTWPCCINYMHYHFVTCVFTKIRWVCIFFHHLCASTGFEMFQYSIGYCPVYVPQFVMCNNVLNISMLLFNVSFHSITHQYWIQYFFSPYLQSTVFIWVAYLWSGDFFSISLYLYFLFFLNVVLRCIPKNIHIYTNIETNLEILHILPKGPRLNTTEQYEINKHKQSPTDIINDQLHYKTHILFDTILHSSHNNISANPTTTNQNIAASSTRTAKHWKWCPWHRKASAKTQVSLTRFLQSEVKIIHIIVQNNTY